MFQIGAFSTLTRVTVRMLRYYDEMGLLKPAWVDPQTGYRLYSVEQIPRLNRIIYLRDSGFQVAEIAAALGSEGDGFMARLLEEKRIEIEKIIQAETEKLRKIDLAKQSLGQVTGEMHDQIVVKAVPGIQVLSLRRVIPDYFGEGALWAELATFAKRHGVEVLADTFSIYHDQDYRERDVDVELCVAVEKAGEDRDGFTYRMTEAVPMMAATMVYGPFSNIAGVYLTFAQWLERNSQYKMAGQSRQIVHRGPWNEENPERYLVEIQIPLEHGK